jgi:hypothetical protein
MTSDHPLETTTTYERALYDESTIINSGNIQITLAVNLCIVAALQSKAARESVSCDPRSEATYASCA